MRLERITYLLEKKDKGTCSPLELQELDDWYMSFSSGESEIENTLKENVAKTESIKSSIYSGIRSQLQLSGDSTENEVELTESVPLIRRWWKQSLAACAVVLLVAGTVLYKNQVFLSQKTIAISTNANETTRVLLPDSSTVWLKPGSKVRYTPQMNSKSERELFLEGEGFFDIAHDASRPFVVHVNNLNIRVLGTVFNVRAHNRDQTVETTLFEGKVRIEQNDGASQDITLTPNQRAVYSKNSQRISVNSLHPAETTATAEKQSNDVSMVFDEKPFTELLTSIEKKFDVTVYIHNRSKQNCLITADLEKENLNDILNLLKISYSIDYKLYGKELFIEGAICKK